jgi:hypothetical protein
MNARTVGAHFHGAPPLNPHHTTQSIPPASVCDCRVSCHKMPTESLPHATNGVGAAAAGGVELASGLHHRRGPAGQDGHGGPPGQLPSTSERATDVEAAISSSEQPSVSKDAAAAGGKAPGDGAAASTAAAAAVGSAEEQYVDVTYCDIAKQFSILGWTAFGGPAAHIGLFQRVRLGFCAWGVFCAAATRQAVARTRQSLRHRWLLHATRGRCCRARLCLARTRTAAHAARDDSQLPHSLLHSHSVPHPRQPSQRTHAHQHHNSGWSSGCAG